MVAPRTCRLSPAGGTGGFRFFPITLLLLAAFAFSARAAIQFDVFLGYDGIVSEASWFPVVCEVKNDRASFTGIVEVSPSSGGLAQEQVRRMVVELPTGTLKRLVIPVFSSARYRSQWDVRLLDERGHVFAEQLGLTPKRQVPSRTVVLGAVPRLPSGAPVIRQVLARSSDAQPATARFQTALVPDNPLALEGLNSFYLNSEKAMELTANQVEALLGWLNAGGHLIIGVEQISDVNGVPWLRKLVPCDLNDVKTLGSHVELEQWVRGLGLTNTASDVSMVSAANRTARRRLMAESGGVQINPFSSLPDDSDFENAGLQVATGKLLGGQVLASSGGVPLMVDSATGRGRVTTLLFSPEREPVRSWKNLPTFWARITDVPPVLYANENYNERGGGWSADGIFGAMIDSKQVRKLPVEWLLLLLIVYLVVIGPLDQYWLKRIKRPMLTWVTFPCYVVLFSLLIYFIGYKLRAGESEWNELHVVDIMVNGNEAEMRGRSFASIYSPVNARYQVESQDHFSTFRGEFQSSWSGGGQDGEKVEVWQNGDNFKADIFVPVWTSQLYVSDWWQSGDLPLTFTVSAVGGDFVVTVANHLEHPLSHAQLVADDRVLDLGDVPAGQSKTFTVAREKGISLRDFVGRHSGVFQAAVSSRQHAFGSSSNGQINDVAESSMASSFLSQISQDQNGYGSGFVSPPGLDLTQVVERGNAVLMAWSPDYSPVPAINKFSPRRSHKDTLWRIAAPLPTMPL